MAFEHVNRVKTFLQSPAAAPITAAERLVLLVIADGIYGNRERVSNHAGWSIEDLVGVKRLRLVLNRLAKHGLEVRVIHAHDSAGKPMYAYRGKQAEYRLPVFATDGAAAEAPFSSPNGAAVAAPSAAVAAASAAVEAASAAVAAPYPDLPDSPDPPDLGTAPAGADAREENLDDQEHRRAIELVDQLQHRQGVGRLKADGRRRLVEAMRRARGRGVSWIQIRESADPSLDGARDRAKVLAVRVDALDPPPVAPVAAPRPPPPPAAFVAPSADYLAAKEALRRPPGRK